MKLTQNPIFRWIVFLSIFFVSWLLALWYLDNPIEQFFRYKKIHRHIQETSLFFSLYITSPIPLLLLTLAAAISAGAAKWRMILHLVIAYLLCGAGVWVGKLIIARQRPKSFTGENWNDSFVGLFPGLSESRYHSFPSGHAAVAFVVSFVLAQYFPRHRYIFYFLAVGCALSRVVLKYHFLSDVILGAMIGYLSAFLINYLAASGKAGPSGKR